MLVCQCGHHLLLRELAPRYLGDYADSLEAKDSGELDVGRERLTSKELWSIETKDLALN